MKNQRDYFSICYRQLKRRAKKLFPLFTEWNYIFTLYSSGEFKAEYRYECPEHEKILLYTSSYQKRFFIENTSVSLGEIK